MKIAGEWENYYWSTGSFNSHGPVGILRPGGQLITQDFMDCDNKLG